MRELVRDLAGIACLAMAAMMSMPLAYAAGGKIAALIFLGINAVLFIVLLVAAACSKSTEQFG